MVFVVSTGGRLLLVVSSISDLSVDLGVWLNPLVRSVHSCVLESSYYRFLIISFSFVIIIVQLSMSVVYVLCCVLVDHFVLGVVVFQDRLFFQLV